MALHIAYRLQGKNLPTYKSNSVNHKQYCIVVNSDTPLVKGQCKPRKKVYRWHSRYPTGLKSRTLREYIERDSVALVHVQIKR